MSETQAIRSRIKHLLVDALHLEGLAPSKIAHDAPLFGEGLGLDSVDALELVVALEKELAIRIQNHQVDREAFASVSALAPSSMDASPSRGTRMSGADPDPGASRAVVVTGLGALSPLGWSLGSLWDGLRSGRTAVGPFDRFDHSGHRTHVAAQVDLAAEPEPPRGKPRRLSIADRFALEREDAARALARVAWSGAAFDATATVSDWGDGHAPLAAALRAASGEAPLPPVLVPKAVTGEYGGGILAPGLLALEGEHFGPTPGFAEPDPAAAVTPHRGGARQIPSRVLLTGLASGGGAAWLVLERTS